MFNKWFRKAAVDPLSVSMAGAKLGDRVLVVGCSDPRLIAALGAKAGLSGRMCAVDESPERAAEAARVALKEGVLVETFSAKPSALPFEGESFDLVVVRDVGNREGQSRSLVVQDAWRLLRLGGRCMIIDTVARSGVSGFFGGQAPASMESGDDVIEILKSGGFVAVRMLAERDGLRFVEAIKRNS